MLFQGCNDRLVAQMRIIETMDPVNFNRSRIHMLSGDQLDSILWFACGVPSAALFLGRRR
jgi:hypothetical protein